MRERRIFDPEAFEVECGEDCFSVPGGELSALEVNQRHLGFDELPVRVELLQCQWLKATPHGQLHRATVGRRLQHVLDLEYQRLLCVARYRSYDAGHADVVK